MNVLDEQVRADQRLLLSGSRIPFRQIGKDIAPSGIKDPNIIPFLHGLKRPTLFTRDHGFFRSELVHEGYCLVWLATSDIEVARYIRRLLRHRRFDSWRKRMGLVVRVGQHRIDFWERGQPLLQHVEWQ